MAEAPAAPTPPALGDSCGTPASRQRDDEQPLALHSHRGTPAIQRLNDEQPLALHSHRGTPAIQRLVEYAPSTGGLALWVAHQDAPAAAPGEPEPPLVCTDGRCIRYGPAFAALPLARQTGLVAHQVLHVALRHPQRQRELQQLLGDVDGALFNLCADAIVNSALRHLGWLQLPPQSVMLDELLARTLRLDMPDEVGLLQWDVENLYRAIDDRRPGTRQASGRNASDSQQAGGRSASSNQQAGTGEQPRAPQPRPDGPIAAAARALCARQPRDLVPGEDTAPPSRPEDAAEEARLWADRLQRAHAGDGALSLLRVLLADLPRSHTPWEQVLRTQLARALAPQRSLSWSRPSRSYIANQGRRRGRAAGAVPIPAPAAVSAAAPAGPGGTAQPAAPPVPGAGPGRMPFEPGFSPSRRVPRLVVVVDVSGSVDPDLLDRFARELEAITRRLEAGLTLVVGDQCVRGVAHFEPGRSTLRDLAFAGGGGTDFTPLLEEAARHRPDTVVVLTDLEGPARFDPRCPVIWAVPRSGRHGAAEPVAPFGRVLML